VIPQDSIQTDKMGKKSAVYAITTPALNNDTQKPPLALPAPPKNEDNPWEISNIQQEDEVPWKDLPLSDKIKHVLTVVTKLVTVVGLLYLFVCSLNFLSNSFRLIAGRATGSVFQNEYMRNPIVGLMIGILVTVLVQSSSTSTSIIVSMVNSGILQVHAAIPMIMGSNIGTSVTNTIVSLTQVGDRNVFRRAFAGATVHDMFNWLSVIVFLTIEVATGALERMTSMMVERTDWSQVTGGKVKLLKVITEPLTKKIIQLDSGVLKQWSLGNPQYENASLVKQFCKYDDVVNASKVGIAGSCKFLFADTALTDTQVGIILLVASLLTLCVALIMIVKILSSIMKGSIASIIRITINADIPYVPWLTGYVAIVIGACMTVVVQSSSIFTSTLTPLIGLGLISVERSYPLTLGSNIGTTTTALLASIAGDGAGIQNSIQIALVHFFFNIAGILLFYPIPFMRFPIGLCKKLGDITAEYRWFAVLYLIVMFFVMPGCIFLISLGGPTALYMVFVPTIILIVFVSIVNYLQEKRPSCLPTGLKTWEAIPLPLRSLQPYDKIITNSFCCKTCRSTDDPILENGDSIRSSNSSNSDSKTITSKDQVASIAYNQTSYHKSNGVDNVAVEIEKP